MLRVWLPVFFLVAYVVSYFLLVETRSFPSGPGSFESRPSYPVPETLRKPVESIYKPLHFLDKNIIRPGFWEAAEAVLQGAGT